MTECIFASNIMCNYGENYNNSRMWFCGSSRLTFSWCTTVGIKLFDIKTYCIWSPSPTCAHSCHETQREVYRRKYTGMWKKQTEFSRIPSQPKDYEDEFTG